MLPSSINILQVGLGPIGQKICQILLKRPRAAIKGAIDISPELQGRDVGELCQQQPNGVIITDNIHPALDAAAIDIAIVTTTSKIQQLQQQIEPIIKAGIPVVTTCEELLHPFHTSPTIADELDTLAKEHQVAILATGVNPGFLMDYMPTIATAITENVTKLTINRIQDAANRRLPFQKKIGAGLSLNDFKQRVEDGSLRHVGLVESVYFIAAKLGWSLDTVTETIAPVIIDGQPQGVKQVALGQTGDTVKIELNFIAAMHQPNPEDRIIVTGSPSFEIVFNPPVNGDTATTAITVNAILSVLEAKPGLQNMASVAPVSYWN